MAAEEMEEEDPDLFRILASSDEVKSGLPQKVVLVCLLWKLSSVLSTFTWLVPFFHGMLWLIRCGLWDVVAHKTHGMLWPMGCCGP